MLTSVRYRWPAFVWLSILAVAPFACGGDADQSAPVPSAMTAVSGDAQTGTVGAALTQSLTVEVRDDAGQPVAGFTVSWSVASGGGSLSAATAQTGTNGQATTSWTLGGTAGSQTVTAAGSGLSVTFTATAEPGPPARVGISGTTTLAALEATTQLTGQVEDEFGNALAGDVTWASADASVATVAADGTVTARANGTAAITATSGSLSGSATVTVAQEAATLAVAPANPVTTVGGTIQMTATGKDANGFDIAGGVTASWASATTTVATIDAAGLATGVAEGQSVITATSGGASGTATLTVTAAPFEPNQDMTIDGDVTAQRISIPAGVTVTLAADATLSSATTLTVEGSIVGDCRGATLSAGGDLTIGGTVNVACADSLAVPGAPGVTLRGASVSVVGADIVSNGEVLVETTGSASASASAGIAGAAAAGGDCMINQASIEAGSVRPTYAAGGRVGADGSPGKNVVLRCAGTMILEGIVMHPGHGEVGGDGRSLNGGEVRGGRGGDGGSVVLEAAAIVFRTEGSTEPVRFPGNVIRLGTGGDGGDADSVGEDALAIGGAAGHAGLPRIEAGTITIQGTQSLELRKPLSPFSRTRVAGLGGRADALGKNGADATATTPAEAGGPAEARGGDGGRLGNAGTTNLIGDVFRGTVENPGGIVLNFDGMTSGPGGTAAAGGGNGGDGSEEFPAGGAGGESTMTGGNAGAATFVDNRSGLPLGDGARGGFLVLGHGDLISTSGSGGQGWHDCVVGGIKPGGTGGAAGRGQGSAGRGTTRAAPDELGGWALAAWGNGGDGGNGVEPGSGGAAGNTDAIAAKGDPEVIGTSLKKGTDGNPCATDMSPSIDVSSDPNGHAPFIGLNGTTSLRVALGPDGTVQITGGGPWVSLQGTVQADGSFEVSGVGTVAGFEGVSVAMTGRLALDADGRVTGIAESTLIADSNNNVLPPNGAGQRNPTVYSVTGTASD